MEELLEHGCKVDLLMEEFLGEDYWKEKQDLLMEEFLEHACKAEFDLLL